MEANAMTNEQSGYQTAVDGMRSDTAAADSDAMRSVFSAIHHLVDAIRELEAAEPAASPEADASGLLVEGDATRRKERADLLKNLAALVERGDALEPIEVLDAIPDAIAARHHSRAFGLRNVERHGSNEEATKAMKTIAAGGPFSLGAVGRFAFAAIAADKAKAKVTQ